MVRGSKDHSNFSGLPGLQQQSQDTSTCYVLHILTRLHTDEKMCKKRLGEEATWTILNSDVVHVFNIKRY